MNAKIISIFVVMIFICTCCGTRIDQNNQKIIERSELESQAFKTINDFYGLLNHKQYQRAAELYGGSYDVLVDYNPSIKKGDESNLLRAACRFNGFVCLDILSAELIDVNDQGEFIYEVKFANPDESEFVLGPCCGATEEEMPPKSSFTVHVECEADGSCLVMDLPPYLP